jgi:hypothetical protein
MMGGEHFAAAGSLHGGGVSRGHDHRYARFGGYYGYYPYYDCGSQYALTNPYLCQYPYSN